jgi:DNA-binding FadR family transcriptional regulator
MVLIDPPVAGKSGARASDAVVHEIGARIASGELPDGLRLPPERDLIETFGVSRTVIREAVAVLASHGLLESRPRHRPVVRRPGFDAALAASDAVVSLLLRLPHGVKNLYDTRIFLEAALTRHAALHARRKDIEALDRALAENEAAIPDSERFYATDMAFHAVLYDIPGNPVLPAVHTAFTGWLAPHWLKMPRSPDRNRINFMRHRDICAAIRDRDPDSAEAALLSHLNAAWEYVRVTFDDA